MNLILFEESELDAELPFDDPRAVHIDEILKLGVGDEFTAGIIGEEKGRGILESRTDRGWRIRFVPVNIPNPVHPVTVILGCPRPPVARRLLKDLCTLGVKEIRVCSTDLNEKSYMTAKLWRDGLWRESLIQGAMQGATTHLPAVRTAADLGRALEDLPDDVNCRRIVFDNDLSAVSMGTNAGVMDAAVIAVGPERGWSDKEREYLVARGFAPTRLGDRILRTETACAVGVALVLAAMGRYKTDF